MDSMAVTTLRTAAASAVAADALARRRADAATFIGCGVQARAHVAAIAAVRPLRRAYVYDIDQDKAAHFAKVVQAEYAFPISVAPDFGDATRVSDIVVTTTSATHAFLCPEHVSPGTFVAAVGADNEHKHELDVSLLRTAALVVDDLEQCATIGDLHHAIDAGALARADVRATLAEVVAGTAAGRRHDDEIIVFDSTGVAIEDVAAAAIVFERAVSDDVGLALPLGG
jgi:ornithine cyclodeaminase/alanine dehydrogenase-like protein (mu-crystallin family)